MFGRNRTRRPSPAAAPPVLPGLQLQTVLVATPDIGAINRERALRLATGRMLQGGAGAVIDYDRGDPAHSFTGVVRGTPDPAAAYARIGRGLDQAQLPHPEAYDLGTTSEQLTAYQSAMLQRITR